MPQIPKFKPEKVATGQDTCKKCEHDQISVMYCPGHDHERDYVCPLGQESEHLHRECQRCRYRWAEKTADAT